MKLILLGAPGAGKGTQAELLSRKLNIPTISTGNILRQAVKDGTEVGVRVKAFMDEGTLVPDEIVLDILKERLAEPDCKEGYILDGVPRNLFQAEALEHDRIDLDAVLSFEISDEVIEKRMTGRRSCTQCGASYHVTNKPPKQEGVCDTCGSALIQRSDDALETVRHRLEVFHAQTEPLKSFYGARGLLKAIENQPTIEATTEVVYKTLGI